jgi:hypothetical protein
MKDTGTLKHRTGGTSYDIYCLIGALGHDLDDEGGLSRVIVRLELTLSPIGPDTQNLYILTSF